PRGPVLVHLRVICSGSSRPREFFAALPLFPLEDRIDSARHETPPQPPRDAMKKILPLLLAAALPLAVSCATEHVQATNVPAKLAVFAPAEIPSPAVPTDPNATLPVDPEITTGK